MNRASTYLYQRPKLILALLLGPPLLYMLVVYLGTLELSAVVYVKRFPFGKDVQTRLSCFAVTVAGAACAPEGKLDFCADCAGVHVQDAGGDVAHCSERIIHIVRED